MENLSRCRVKATNVWGWRNADPSRYLFGVAVSVKRPKDAADFATILTDGGQVVQAELGDVVLAADRLRWTA